MFTIRQHQEAAFARAAEGEFEDRMVKHLCEEFPTSPRAQDEEALRTLVRRGLERAARWGIEEEFGVCLYLHVMVELGESFDEDPQHAFARAALEDTRWDPERRVSELHDTVFSLDDPKGGKGEGR